MEVRCPAEADTEALGGRLAASLRPGDVVVLAGGLGVGKTVFTRGLAIGLGVEEPVLSPSFVLMRQYRTGFMPVVHLDVYRLGSLNEFEDLEVFDAGVEGVVVIEWGEAVDAMVPQDHLRVELEVSEDGSRLVSFVPSGDWCRRSLEDLL